MLTFLVLNVADTKQKLGNDVFQAAGVAQKYNCSLVRLDYQQEQGLVSSLPLGIKRMIFPCTEMYFSFSNVFISLSKLAVTP